MTGKGAEDGGRVEEEEVGKRAAGDGLITRLVSQGKRKVLAPTHMVSHDHYKI